MIRVFECRLMVALVLGLAVHGAVGATQPAPPATAPALQAIRYERTGGFAGTRDVVEITRTGEVVVSGRLMGQGKAQLTPQQMAQLAKLFADWKTLKPSYPNPPGSADGFVIRIRWDTLEVTAGELNAELPAPFKAAREMIEKLAEQTTSRR